MLWYLLGVIALTIFKYTCVIPATLRWICHSVVLLQLPGV
jgi:hypothetical protein